MPMMTTLKVGLCIVFIHLRLSFVFFYCFSISKQRQLCKEEVEVDQLAVDYFNNNNSNRWELEDNNNNSSYYNRPL